VIITSYTHALNGTEAEYIITLLVFSEPSPWRQTYIQQC